MQTLMTFYRTKCLASHSTNTRLLAEIAPKYYGKAARFGGMETGSVSGGERGMGGREEVWGVGLGEWEWEELSVLSES